MASSTGSSIQDSFLLRAFDAAKAANHIWPEFAACEVALESAWGQSHLALEANNLFGEKQHATNPIFETLDMPTHEFIHGQMVPVMAHWVKFPDWQSCFKERMQLLYRLTVFYSAALSASNGTDFIREVSIHWSTDPARADKVLMIHSLHQNVFSV
jgi:flagellum-specific peptidoglycan hydrolase FlgJ